MMMYKSANPSKCISLFLVMSIYERKAKVSMFKDGIVMENYSVTSQCFLKGIKKPIT